MLVPGGNNIGLGFKNIYTFLLSWRILIERNRIFQEQQNLEHLAKLSCDGVVINLNKISNIQTILILLLGGMHLKRVFVPEGI